MMLSALRCSQLRSMARCQLLMPSKFPSSDRRGRHRYQRYVGQAPQKPRERNLHGRCYQSASSQALNRFRCFKVAPAILPGDFSHVWAEVDVIPNSTKVLPPFF
jgi:hypothetical protein